MFSTGYEQPYKELRSRLMSDGDVYLLDYCVKKLIEEFPGFQPIFNRNKQQFRGNWWRFKRRQKESLKENKCYTFEMSCPSAFTTGKEQVYEELRSRLSNGDHYLLNYNSEELIEAFPDFQPILQRNKKLFHKNWFKFRTQQKYFLIDNKRLTFARNGNNNVQQLGRKDPPVPSRGCAQQAVAGDEALERAMNVKQKDDDGRKTKLEHEKRENQVQLHKRKAEQCEAAAETGQEQMEREKPAIDNGTSGLREAMTQYRSDLQFICTYLETEVIPSLLKRCRGVEGFNSVMKDWKGKKLSLSQRINELRYSQENGIGLDGSTASLFHNVRLLGNKAVHDAKALKADASEKRCIDEFRRYLVKMKPWDETP